MLWGAYREEAPKHGHSIRPGDEAAWGGLLICAPTDALAEEQMNEMRWFWDNWAALFGQPLPELLVGSPDTLSRRLEEAQAAIDPQEVFLLIPQGVHDRGQVLASLELFADKVLPRFG
jgi:alkanesulfonate monooxygenase SsuD/methylene tetrahydromethanopterin reductase-like flavin-dependent oxidoreductase (luciferase family)